ncbi:hypothetical protein Tco_0567186 [Tanacetum coccineum]
MEKVDTSKELDASSIIIESNRTESQKQDTSSRSGNDADIKPIYDEEPMAEVQMTADNNVFAIGQQHTEQPESNNEGEVDQNADQCYDTRPLPAKLIDNRINELSNQLLESENVYLKKTVAQSSKDLQKLKAHYVLDHGTTAISELKKLIENCKGKSVETQFNKPSVVRQPTAFKSERPRISKPRFASQVDVNNDLSKPVTTHHLPKGRESAPAKPHHMIAPSSSRYSSNDIVHNHYLEEAKKKTHKHSRIPRNFSDSKHFVCSTCQKCVFNANHDAWVIKFLKEVNSRAKVPSNTTTNKNKPVEQIRVATKPKRQIPKGHRFSIKKTTTVHEKTTSLRSCLRWQPTGRILKTVCLRWVPTGKTFASSTTKVESEPPNGSNADIPNQCESEQALNVSAGTLLSTGTSFNPTEEGLRVWLRKRKISSAENNTSGPVPQSVQASVINVQMVSAEKITLQAPFLNVQKTFDYSRSSLGLHGNDVCSHQFRPRSSSNDF